MEHLLPEQVERVLAQMMSFLQEKARATRVRHAAVRREACRCGR